MAYPELVKTNHELGPRPTGKREQPQPELNCQTSTIPKAHHPTISLPRENAHKLQALVTHHSF